MIPLLVLEVVVLPLYLFSIYLMHKYGLLTENRFGLMVVACLSVMTMTASNLFPPVSAGRVTGLVLSVLCWFPGYPIAKRVYRRVFLQQRK